MSTVTLADDDGRSTATATAGQTIFNTDFPVMNKEDVTVWKLDVGGSVANKLTLDVDYTMSNLAAQNGATVTLTTGATAGDLIVIHLTPPFDFSTLFSDTTFKATVLNGLIRDIVQYLQAVRRDISRVPGLPPEEDGIAATYPKLADRQNNFAGWDSAGNLIAVSGVLPGTVVTSTFGESVVNAADAAASLTLHGYSAFVQTLKAAADAAAYRTLIDAASLTAANVFTNHNSFGKQVRLTEQTPSITAASQLPITTDANFFRVGGSTTIQTIANSLGVGTEIELEFLSNPLIEDGPFLSLPNNENFQTAAGDILRFRQVNLGGLAWMMTGGVRFNGQPVISPIVKGTDLVVDPITATTAQSQAHGLGVEPDDVKAIMECKTAELGWSVGDRIIVSTQGTNHFNSSRGFMVEVDATDVTVYIAATVWAITHKTTQVFSNIVLANWKLILTPVRYRT